MRSTVVAMSAALVLLPLISTAYGQPRTGPKLVDMSHVKTIEPTQGFIDDPFIFDGAGGRLLYINADAGYLAELTIIDLTQGAAQLKKIDISGFTTTPTMVRFITEGFFVISRPSDIDQATAAVISPEGKVLRTFGPATDIALTERDGQPVVALYTRTEKKAKVKGKPVTLTEHKVEALTLAQKKRLGKVRVLAADDKGYVAKLDFRINHWANGYTRVIGIKGGNWDAKQNQRSPDTEGWYDNVTGVFEKTIDIADVMAHAYKMRAFARHNNEDEFLDVAEDLSGVDLVTQAGRTRIELAQPFMHYDPKTLEYRPTQDGLYLFTLKIDPVNKEAAARKRADAEYLDLYSYRSGEKKAMRIARMLLTDKKKRLMNWQATEEYWAIVPRLIGFSRGGKEMQIYKITRNAP